MKNLTMKKEYVFRIIHPSFIIKMRRKYQNFSLTKKLKWRESIRKSSLKNGSCK